MKRARPDMVLHWPNVTALYWGPGRRCPRRCEFRGEDHRGDTHVEYRNKRDRSRPAPMLRAVKR